LLPARVKAIESDPILLRGPVAREFHDETFTLRFTGLTSDAQSRLRSALAAFKIESRNPEIAVVILQPDLDLLQLYRFLEQEDFEPSSYGVWVSLVTSRERDMVKVPQRILDLIRTTAAGLVFSFVACLTLDVE